MIYGFYEDEYPEYSDELVSEIQSEVKAEEVNYLVTQIKELKAELAAANKKIEELEKRINDMEWASGSGSLGSLGSAY